MNAFEPIDGSSLTGVELNCWELLLSSLSLQWTLLKRKLPVLVWYGQDIDVQIKFTDLRLAPDCTVDNLRYEGDRETLWRAEQALHQLGLTFDAGTGRNGRDWEFDWSLRGPIQLSFRGKHKGDRKPKHPRPALRLVKSDKDSV